MTSPQLWRSRLGNPFLTITWLGSLHWNLVVLLVPVSLAQQLEVQCPFLTFDMVRPSLFSTNTRAASNLPYLLYREKRKRHANSLRSSGCWTPMMHGCACFTNLFFWLVRWTDCKCSKENQLKQKQKEEEEKANAVRRVCAFRIPMSCVCLIADVPCFIAIPVLRLHLPYFWRITLPLYHHIACLSIPIS